MRAPLIVSSILLSAWVLLFSPLGHFSADSGVKLIQAHDLWQSGMSSRAVHTSPAFVPVDHYRRIGNEFEYKRGDEWQGIYSIVFVALEAPLVAAGGLRAAYLLPLLGGLLGLAGIWLALRRLGAREPTVWLACLFAATSTPLLFYSGQFFEHTLASGLVMLGLALLAPSPQEDDSPPRPILAGALLAGAAIFRPEAYCAIAATGLALLALPGSPGLRIRRGLLFLGGALPVLGAYWTFNHFTAGSWDPLVTINARRAGASTRSVLRMLWGDLQHGPNASFVAPLVVAMLVGLVPERWRRGSLRTALHILTAVLLLLTAWNAYRWANGRIVAGLFAVTPLAAYGLLAGPWNPRTRVYWIFSLVFVPMVVLLESSGVGGGLQLGARLLLPALPVLVVLAAHTAEDDWRAVAGGARMARIATAVPLAALLALSIAADAKGTWQAFRIAQAGEVAWRQAVQAPGKLIVAKVEWHAGVLSPAILQGKEIVISRDGDDRRLFGLLAEAWVEDFLYCGKPVQASVATSRGTATLGDVRGRTLPRALGGLVLRDVHIVQP